MTSVLPVLFLEGGHPSWKGRQTQLFEKPWIMNKTIFKGFSEHLPH